MRRVLVPLAIAPAPLPIGGVQHLQGVTMGTTWMVKLVTNARAIPELQAGIELILDTIVRQMSTWLAHSDVSRFNDAPIGSWHSLPGEFYQVLDFGLRIAAESDGAFDITAGALVNLWGFGPTRDAAEESQPPAPAEIEQARSCCGWRRLVIDRHDRRVQQTGVQLDFSAIAKGFAVDQIARYLAHRGCGHYLVEVGGELRGAGFKPDGQPWWVALENPDGSMDASGTLIALHELAIATSGDYRRYFEREGLRYCHSIDPRLGLPIRNGLASVSVVHRNCMAADALSTALTVMGVEQGMAFAKQCDLAARFLVREAHGLAEHHSPAFAAMLQ